MMYKTAMEKLLDNEVEVEEGMILLEQETFIDSMIGVPSDMRAVYDYDKMVVEYMSRTGCGFEDALDYVDQGVVRWVECYGEKAPIVMDGFMFDGNDQGKEGDRD